MTSSKEIVTNYNVSSAVSAAKREGLTEHADIECRIQDEDMLGRDLSRRERNMVRSWFDLPAEITETDRCA